MCLWSLLDDSAKRLIISSELKFRLSTMSLSLANIISAENQASSIVLHSLFLRATAGAAIARLSHRNSVCLSVCLSVRHTGGSGNNGAS